MKTAVNTLPRSKEMIVIGSESLTLDIHQSVEIKAGLDDAYEALIHRLSAGNTTPDNRPLPMVFEAWPGGRWFRDFGEGQGHLWGFVQVIKPPTLIELHGPMFMSYAVASHLQFRLSPVDNGTELSLRHQVLGKVEEEHRRGMVTGWGFMLQRVKEESHK